MLIKKWRCDMPSCKTLIFDTEDSIRAHQNKHFYESCKLWEIDCVCPWPKCRSRALRFKSSTTFRQHLRTHLKSMWCLRSGCQYDKPFRNRSDLDRHVRTIHDYNESHAFRCPLESCSQSFVRGDKLEEHIRRAHKTCRCSYDHCGKIILDAQATKDEHLTNHHQDKTIFECSLRGCESTTSRFTRQGVIRHLCAHHGLDRISDSVRTYIRIVEHTKKGDIFRMSRMTMPLWASCWYSLPCKICTQKVASVSEPQAIGDGDGTEMVNNGTTMA